MYHVQGVIYTIIMPTLKLQVDTEIYYVTIDTNLNKLEINACDSTNSEIKWATTINGEIIGQTYGTPFKVSEIYSSLLLYPKNRNGTKIHFTKFHNIIQILFDRTIDSNTYINTIYLRKVEEEKKEEKESVLVKENDELKQKIKDMEEKQKALINVLDNGLKMITGKSDNVEPKVEGTSKQEFTDFVTWLCQFGINRNTVGVRARLEKNDHITNILAKNGM